MPMCRLQGCAALCHMVQADPATYAGPLAALADQHDRIFDLQVWKPGLHLVHGHIHDRECVRWRTRMANGRHQLKPLDPVFNSANLGTLMTDAMCHSLLQRKSGRFPKRIQRKRTRNFSLTLAMHCNIHSNTRYKAWHYLEKTRNRNPRRSGKRKLRKGCLELAILACLWDQRLYGLEILRGLEQNSNLVLAEGTVYPIWRD